MDIISYILSKRYCDNAIVGLGTIRGANCTIDNIVHQDGINTVTFKWTGTDGTIKTRDMIVYDGTPIYVWESGNTYHYGDLAIYESQFYRCIVENSDITFDNTKWNEIGSPDGNYDLVQSKVLLPARFTAADRKLYFVIDECIFYLWDGTQWVAQTHLVQESVMPTASAKYLGRMYQYIGITDANFTHGYVYECVSDGQTIPTFTWENVEVQPCIASHTTYDNTNSGLTATNVQDAIDETITIKQNVMQYAVLPTASVDNLGVVYQYIGATTVDYHHGCFYECVSDGAVTPTYSWKNIGLVPTFTNTQEVWDSLTPAQQNQYIIVNITDDEEEINLGVYLRKLSTMPNAEDCPSEVVMYVGTTNVDYTRGYIYRSVPSVVSGETVYNWERQDTQPSHPYVQSDYAQNDSTAIDYIKNKPTLGTASAKNFTDNVRPNSHDLVESNAVYNAISSSIASIYKPHGDLTCAQLTSDLLITTNIGNVYNMTDSGTTSALFIQGAGKTINIGDTVGIIQADNSTIMFNLMGSMIDLHDYQKQKLSTPLTIGGVQETDVEDALEALNDVKATQFVTMPTASVDYVGTIVQYVGATTSTYTQGYWYKCVSDGAVSPSYSWEVIEIQSKATLISTMERYNVHDYGVMGDGITDDTTALQNLINSIPSGSVVFFPNGIYNISDTISLTKNIKLVGETSYVRRKDWVASYITGSILNYIGGADNTILKRTVYCNVDIEGLSFKGNAFEITENTDAFVSLPYPYCKEHIIINNINGLDLHTVGGKASIHDCYFSGFSSYGLMCFMHMEVRNCGFFNCYKGVDAPADGMILNCWFNFCGVCIEPQEYSNSNHNKSINVSDCWFDVISRHVIANDSANQATTMIMLENAWISMVDGSAIYFPNDYLLKCSISGKFSRIGMAYAGLNDADRTDEISKMSDVIYARRIEDCEFDINIGGTTISIDNTEKECMSRLIAVNSFIVKNVYILCNQFSINKIYSETCTAISTNVLVVKEGRITRHRNFNYINGTLIYPRSPIGRALAPFEGYYCLDTSSNILYRSTAADDNTAWEIVTEPIQINTLPTASVDNVGKVYIYTGTTTQYYVHGGIYECQEITPSTDPKTYHWVLISSVDMVEFTQQELEAMW